MQQNRELRDLARAIAAFREHGDARYPKKLRARITTWVIAQRERGEWWTEISAALEIPSKTLVRWVEMQSGGVGEVRAVDVM